MKLIKLSFVLFSLLIVNNIFGQLTFPNTGANMTPTQFVQNYLVGGGVTVTNVTFTGVLAKQIGRFTTGNNPTNLGMTNGVILSTGNVTDAGGTQTGTVSVANTSGAAGSDADLFELSGFDIEDKAILEFDFIPISDTVKFNYVFASEEYPNFANGSFNDVFGFFLSGPGITGTFSNNSVNIAIIPGTTNTPVTINNLNNGSTSCTSGGPSGPCEYCTYYVNNCGGTTIEYGGFTKKMKAWRIVQPCQTYHIKIAIADAGDQDYDSSVFLEAGSLVSNGLTAATTYTGPGSGNAIRGCVSSSAAVVFSLSQVSNTPTTINFTIGGTATNGVDYQTIQPSVTIPAGQTSATVTISPLMNTQVNPQIETVILTTQTACSSSDITVNIKNADPPVISVNNATICLGTYATLTATVTGGISPYTYQWSAGASNTTNTISVNPAVSTDYYLTVTDQCSSYYDTAHVIISPNLTTTGATISPTSCAGYPVTLSVNPVGGVAPYSYYWNTGTTNTTNTITVSPVTATSYYVTITDMCRTYKDTLEVTVNPNPIAAFTIPPVCGTPTGATHNLAIITNNTTQAGTNTIWNWTFGGNPQPYSTTNVQNPQPLWWNDVATTTTYPITLIVTNAVTGCKDTASQQVQVLPSNTSPGCCIVPLTNAGLDGSTCGKTYQLSGSVNPSTVGTWTLVSGPVGETATFLPNINDAHAVVTVSDTGIYQFQWNEISGSVSCQASDVVDIKFQCYPLQTDAGPDIYICGHKYQLVAAETPNTTGAWTVVTSPAGSTFTFSPDNTTSGATIAVLDTGTYVLAWTEKSCETCFTSDHLTVKFICNPTPTNAGPANDSICGNIYTFTDIAINPYTTGKWIIVSGSGTATFAPNDSTAHATVTVSTPGSYVFQWKEKSCEVCFSSDQIHVTFVKFPVANAGPDQVDVCDTTAHLAAVYENQNSTGQWRDLLGHAIFAPSTSNTAQALLIDDTYGIHEFMWIENYYGCKDTDYVQITYHEQPRPDAGPSQDICGNLVTLVGTSNSSITDGYWTGPTGAIYYPASTSATVNVMMLVGVDTSSMVLPFYWHQTNEMCHDSSKVVHILHPTSWEAYAGDNAEICSASSYTLSGEVVGGTGTGIWTSNSDVTITNPTSPNATVTLNPIDTIWSRDSKYEAILKWTVTTGANCFRADTMMIKYYESPVANAGIFNEATCNNVATLHAIPSLTASLGTWAGTPQTNLTCPSILYGNIHDTASTVTGCNGKTLTFVWTEEHNLNSLCKSTDTITVQFVKTPDIEAGDSISVCGNKVQLHAVSDTSSEFGTWSTVSSVAINYLDTNGINTDMTQITNPDAWIKKPSAVNIEVGLIWSEYNQSSIPNLVHPLQCYSKDTVPVFFYVNYPATLLCPDSNFVCGKIDSTLHAAQPPEGVGHWVDVTSIATFTPNNYPSNLNTQIEVTNSSVKHKVYWIVENGKCIDSSNAITIQFIDLPIANSGGTLWASNPDSLVPIKWDTVCGNSYILHPGAYGTATPLWTSTDNNIKFNTSGSTTTGLSIDTVVVPSNLYNSVVVNPPYYSLAFTVDNSVLTYPPFTRGCKHSDTLRLTFAKIPSGLIDYKMATCAGDSIAISAKYDQEGKPIRFVWDFQGGKTDTTINNIITPYPIDSTYYLTWDTVGGDTSHFVKLITENAWGCRSLQVTDTIFEPKSRNPSDSIWHATCLEDNGRIKLNPIPGLSTEKYSYRWLDPVFASNPIVYDRSNLASGVPYHLLFTYKSFTDSGKFCKLYFTETLRDTGQVYADFKQVEGEPGPILPGDEVVFKNTTIDGKTYEWHFGDGGLSTAENPSHVYTKPGEYSVFLVAKSAQDCESRSDSIVVKVDASSNLTVPNIFTPNGDGKNDYFQVDAKSLKSFHGIISNRWGKTLYQWDEWDMKKYPTSGWDGKIGSSEASPGVYFYIIKAEGYNEEDKYDMKGAFHLERDK